MGVVFDLRNLDDLRLGLRGRFRERGIINQDILVVTDFTRTLDVCLSIHVVGEEKWSGPLRVPPLKQPAPVQAICLSSRLSQEALPFGLGQFDYSRSGAF